MARLTRPLLIASAAAALAALVALARRSLRRVRGQYFDSAGVRIHFTDEGRGEPLVLLHGFAVNADLNFRLPGLIRALRREFRVIAMDLRGHGLSGKPHGAEHYGQQMVEDVIRLLDHLGIQRAHVVGYSLGGIITLKLAAEHPERLITASPLGAGWESPQHSAFLDSIEDIARALESGRGIGPLAGRIGGRRQAPSLGHRFWVLFMTRFLNDGRALSGVVRGIPRLAVDETALLRITTPVCCIVGGRDPLLPGALALKEKLPHVELTVIKGADHLSAVGRPELRRTLLAFLRRHPQRP